MTFFVRVPERIDIFAIADFLADVYDPPREKIKKTFLTVLRHDPSVRPGNFILAEDARGRLIGVIRLAERRLIVDGNHISCAGITSVGVAKKWQGRGVCAAMMKKAIAVMTKRAFGLSVLHARRVLDGFYLSFGYRGIGRYHELEILNLSRLASPGFRAVEFCREEADFLRACYEKTYRSLTGSMVRTPALWELIFSKIDRGISRAKIHLFYSGTKKIGYGAVIDRTLVELSLPEKFFPDLAGWMGEKQLLMVGVHPGHPFFRFCRRSFNTLYKERFALDGGYMARLIDVKSVVRLLSSRHYPRLECSQRWRVLLGIDGWKESPSLFFHTSVLDEM